MPFSREKKECVCDKPDEIEDSTFRQRSRRTTAATQNGWTEREKSKKKRKKGKTIDVVVVGDTSIQKQSNLILFSLSLAFARGKRSN